MSDKVSNILWPREGHYRSLFVKFLIANFLWVEFKLLPDLLLGDSVFVELEVQEDCVLHHISIGCNSSRIRGGFIFCSSRYVEDKFANDCPVPASLNEAMVQEAHEVSKFLLVGVLFEVPLH